MKQYFFLIAFSIMLYSCNCSSWGDNRLVDKISLLEGDKLEDRAIIYCSNIKNGCCYGGPYIVPSFEESYYKYVAEAKENEGWIIAKVVIIRNNKIEYFIIKNFSLDSYTGQNEKIDSIIQEHVFGPFNGQTFSKELEKRNIKIKF